MTATREPIPIPYRTVRVICFASILVVRYSAAFRFEPLFAALNENLDAPVFGAPLRGRIAGDWSVRALAFDFDPRPIGQSRLENGGNGLRALNREFKIGGETDVMDRGIVGVPDD